MKITQSGFQLEVICEHLNLIQLRLHWQVERLQPASERTAVQLFQSKMLSEGSNERLNIKILLFSALLASTLER